MTADELLSKAESKEKGSGLIDAIGDVLDSGPIATIGTT